MKPRKVPMRMCVGCRDMKPKKELIRVVRSPEGAVHIDLTSKASGRGAYVCADFACLERAVKTKALERALQQKIDDSVFETLRAELEGRGAHP